MIPSPRKTLLFCPSLKVEPSPQQDHFITAVLSVPAIQAVAPRSVIHRAVREPPSGPAHRLRSNAGRVREHHQRSRSLCLTPARDREGIGISRESDLARLTAGRAFSFRPVAILPFLRAWRPATGDRDGALTRRARGFDVAM
jgi:hypothetical protein